MVGLELNYSDESNLTHLIYSAYPASRLNKYAPHSSARAVLAGAIAGAVAGGVAGGVLAAAATTPPAALPLAHTSGGCVRLRSSHLI